MAIKRVVHYVIKNNFEEKTKHIDYQDLLELEDAIQAIKRFKTRKPYFDSEESEKIRALHLALTNLLRNRDEDIGQ